MTSDEIDKIIERQQAANHRRPDERKIKIRNIRNVLNIIFMIIAVVGVIIYLTGDKTIGLYVFIVSIPFKFIEVAIRILRL